MTTELPQPTAKKPTQKITSVGEDSGNFQILLAETQNTAGLLLWQFDDSLENSKAENVTHIELLPKRRQLFRIIPNTTKQTPSTKESSYNPAILFYLYMPMN